MSSHLLHPPIFATYSMTGFGAARETIMSDVLPSPTVEFGRDFDSILYRCLQEHLSPHDTGSSATLTTIINTGSKSIYKNDRADAAKSFDKSDTDSTGECKEMDNSYMVKSNTSIRSEKIGKLLLGIKENINNSSKKEEVVVMGTDDLPRLDDSQCGNDIIANNTLECEESNAANDHSCTSQPSCTLSSDICTKACTIVKYPSWKPARKKPRTKLQGHGKKWRRHSSEDFDIGFTYVKPFTRGCVSELTKDMDKELVTFEKACEEEPKQSTSEVTSAADPPKKPIPSTRIFTEAEEEKFYFGISELFECEYKAIINAYGLSHKLCIEGDRISLRHGHLRQKKKWAIQKAHKQVKTKYCTSVKNGGLGKYLYVSSRVANLMPMAIDKMSSSMYHISIKRIDKCKGISREVKLKDIINNSSPAFMKQRGLAARPDRNDPPPPAYALNAYNADGALENDLVNILMAAQHRELTPEDYELLLRLDERVAPKTVDEGIIDRLPTDCACGMDGSCAVCMEEYRAGDERKILPCGHAFHSDCITTWLSNSSMNCPLDGMEVR